MSRWAIGILAVFLAAVLAGDAFAKGGGGRGGGHGGGHGGGKHGFSRGHGGGHHFGGHRGGFSRHAVKRGHFGGPRHAARHPNFGHMRHAALAPGRNAMNLLSRPGALRHGKFLSSPAARTQLVAAAALAGWHGGGYGNGWWRHGNGGYGWVGPLFWPFAYNDIYDYAIWDDGLGFWGYGYPDIYAGIFPPYGYSDLAGYFPQPRWDRRRGGRPIAIGAMCGNDSRAVAGMPVDQIADAVQPTGPQLAALSELGQTSLTAAQNIRIACPSQAMLTAPGRLAAMQQRIEAMISATALIQPRLERFYGLLDDEQKARLNGLADSQRKAVPSADSSSPTQNCGAPGPAALQWPTSEIEARIRPNETQKAALQVLQDTSARVAEELKAACQTGGQLLTPPARMAAAARRLDAMLQAVKQVRAAVEDFYATLNDEQRAAFEAIGPARPA